MPKNRLRERLRKRETSCGLWVTLESATVTEIAVTLGLDWVCIDMEHGHLGFREVMEHVRVVRGSPTTALVRVPEIGQSSIKRALDIGARGVRGVSGERAVQWGLGLQEYLSDADEETLIIPIIETREAVEEIDALLEAPGLEAIFFGPADLSASHGHLGEWEGPGMAERILEIRGKAAAKVCRAAARLRWLLNV